MTRTVRMLIVSAAMSGLVAGAVISGGCDSKKDSGTTGTGTTNASPASDKHSCKGQNSCKGKGGCSTGDMGCKGKNSCKGKGGCSM